MNEEELFFDPWDPQCKCPFGAVAEGTEVSFSFHCLNADVRPVLVLLKEGEQEVVYEMSPPTSDMWFRRSVEISQGKGLYFYWFRLVSRQTGEIIGTYGENPEGGDGLFSSEGSPCFYQLTCYEPVDQAPEWYQEAIFYQIFPDRFCNGNPSGQVTAPKENSFLYGSEKDAPFYVRNKANEIERWDFQGGNLAGIREKIPYLKQLGITALYLNPIFEAVSNHRYDTADYLAIDPMLGTETEFRDFVAYLHEEGFHVILDGVFSHVGKISRYFNADGRYGEAEGAAQRKESPYYPWFHFTDYPKEYKAWWGVKDLPEVDKTVESFQAFIYGEEQSVLQKWQTAGIDGWRLDVADELPDPFIAGIRNRLNQYKDQILLGEVWEDASNKIAYEKRRGYVLGSHLHGVMNYPLRQAIIDGLTRVRTPKEIAHSLTKLMENYPPDILNNSLNNLGTHDTERILSMLNEDRERLFSAIGFLFMMPGVPCIYYGDEAGLTGGKDPDNRKFFPWWAIEEAIYTCHRTWADRRKTTEVLKRGDTDFFFSERLFGIVRYSEEMLAVYVINMSEDLVVFQEENCETFKKLSLQKRHLVEQLLFEQVLDPKATVFKTTNTGTSKER